METIDKVKLLDIITREEGYRDKPYHCSENYPTIGVGLRIGPKGASLDNYTFTMDQATAQAAMLDKIGQILIKLNGQKWFKSLNPARKSIIISMCYQMGFNGVMRFKKMISAIGQGEYIVAGREMLDSRWAKQTPARAQRHAEVMRTGSTEGVY